MTAYADTSVFVSLYLADAHSLRAQELIVEPPGVWLTPLHIAEWTHAVEQHVFRKLLAVEASARLHDSFHKDRENGLWTQVPVPEAAYSLCAEIARRNVARLGVRTIDSLHVACALELGATVFHTFDERQGKLARALGLKITR